MIVTQNSSCSRLLGDYTSFLAMTEGEGGGDWKRERKEKAGEERKEKKEVKGRYR